MAPEDNLVFTSFVVVNKSRKPNTCGCCGETIPAGSKYANMKGKTREGFFSLPICMKCAPDEEEMDKGQIVLPKQVKKCS